MGPPSSPLQAGFEGVALACFLLLLGWLVAEAVTYRLDLETLTRAGLSLFGLGLLTLAVMVAQIATRGAVLENAWVARGIVIGAFVVLGAGRLLWRRRGPAAGWRAWAAMLALSVLSLGVWGTTTFRAFPVNFGGDTYMHSAYTQELLNGESTPSAAITGKIPNSYPWLFHGTQALVADLTPGGHAVDALTPLELTMVAGTVMALFALGREVTRRAGGGAGLALLAGMGGGWGYFLARRPALIYAPRGHETVWWGDFLFVRSYNPAFYQLTPPFPRDLAFVFLVAGLALAVHGMRSSSTGSLLLAGVSVGLAGLTNAEAFFVGMLTLAALSAFPIGVTRPKAAMCLLLPAVGVYLFWALPQAISYVQLGGYVNLTVVGPVTLPAWAILFGWGMITPFAIVGVGRRLRDIFSDPGVRVALVVCLAAGVLVFLSTFVPRLLGNAFMSVGRAHRYWPLLGFGLALWGAAGLAWLTMRVPGVVPKAALWVAAIGLCIPSPVLASDRLVSRAQPLGAIPTAARGDPTALFNLIGPGRGRCVVAAPAGIGRQVWAYTGYRMVMYWTSVNRSTNQSRVRWRNIYKRITPEAQRIEANRVLVGGMAAKRVWRRVARHFGVDVVVVKNSVLATHLTRFPRGGTEATDAPFTVFRLSHCGS